MGVALKAEHVVIRYITGDFKDIGIKEYVVRKLTGNYHVHEFKAVDDVSFELEKGDLLGIIGSNGAGKSTLLKAVAGIMAPTHGWIAANGDIAALLELGSGFDGDLTVKENAYLRGAMLGYTKEFMDSTYDQIIDFAELREFEDRPFKQLSSGMKSRLAFSIASLVNPDILILDEVLSVGDGAFQEKSAKKMREIMGQGATTILVSHSLDQIRDLCNKVLWLDHGKQIAFGETQEICDKYEKFLRGECGLPQRECVEQSEPEPVVKSHSEPARTRKHRRRIGVKALVACLVMALFFGSLAGRISSQLIPALQPKSTVEITAKEGTGTVTYRGASVDGTWYSPQETLVSDGGWTEDPEEVTYTANGQEPLVIQLPSGVERSLTFDVGPDQGVAIVTCDGETMEFSMTIDTDWELGYGYSVPASETISENVYVLIGVISALVLFALFAVSCYCRPNRAPRSTQPRELWGDLLRAVCCFVVVLLHCTCNLVNSFGESVQSWIPHLLMNSFTAFAVPCFFMLSGAYLLRKEHGIKETWRKRFPKAYIPLIIWTVFYLMMYGNFEASSYGTMFYQSQVSHLWFMYSIVSIYILLPLLSRMYLSLNHKAKIYLLIILLVVPTVLHDVPHLANRYVSVPSFALFWPDLGLFFLGGFLWDCREWFSNRKKWSGVAFAAGFLVTVLFTLYVSLRDGVPNKVFISCIGSIGVVLMAMGLFGLGYALEPKLQTCPNVLKRLLLTLGESSFGIYLIHIAVMHLYNHGTIPFLPLYSNEGNLLQMFIGAIIYFAASALLCWCGKQIPGVRKIV